LARGEATVARAPIMARHLSRCSRFFRFPRGRCWSLGALGAAIAATSALAGCTPSIGDKCVLNTDCSLRGDRVCDTSQPNGYCTVIGCAPDSCPDKAACVMFHASLPGCPYDDYHAPPRTGRTFCMARCASDSDCRQGDGYICRSPGEAPWRAVIVDDDQTQRVCIQAPNPMSMATAAPEAGVCQTILPPPEAGTPVDGAADSAGDASGDASEDASGDADAGDDGSADSGAPDAPGGG
jgi:hypothetical protein